MKYMKWLGCMSLGLLAAFAAWAAAAGMSVQVKSAPLREAPSFLGKVIGTLDYGDRVEASENQAGWVNVKRADGAAGWIHQSALTPKRIVLRAGEEDVDVRASQEEVALAGKGFNAQLEADFKSQHAEISFAWVDKMEAMKVSPQKIVTFLQEGGVTPLQGGIR